MKTIEQACQDAICHLQKRRVNDRILERCTESFYAGAEFERKNNEEKLQKQNETLLKITGWDQPYNLNEILSRLVFATDYLLHVKDYDGHNHEELNQSIDRAKEIMQFLETREAHFL